MDFNTESEVRNGYHVSEFMKQIWKVETDLLSKLLDVCERYGLRCWVDGGTMLGAVRHGGFIPWDDDIDVCMPRTDYDKLISIGQKEFHHPYFLQSAYSDNQYFRGHAQLRNSLTTAIRPSEAYRPFNQGIFIDIFPLDGVPDDPQETKQLIHSIHKTYSYLKAANLHILYSGRLGQIFRKIRCNRWVKREGWSNIYAVTENKLRQTSVETADRWAELSFSGDDIVFDKSLFSQTVWLNFENIKVPVPVGYDKFLRTQYGDNYMTPMKAPNYHGELVFSVNRSYDEVRPEVVRQYKHDTFRRLKKKLSKKK